ncbi:GIY-YIG nuclease family protein [Jiella mangrovi]|uniref:GIY-YIG nuclease family protein n=1 Tax=Jiella mangrovi TaxID=2821407 RepID=A0ABS4BM45_9HYPH|nr:GIY-YIG nuclease family protein [Jiella mangrovi]MBP0617799.1 GIY-YIG nuclease family protein [Jiella mangrovi]
MDASVLVQDAPFVVYAICDPVIDLPVYVGQTGNIVQRFSTHMQFWHGVECPKRYPSLSRWLATLGQSPFIRQAGQPTHLHLGNPRRKKRLILPDPWVASHADHYGDGPVMPRLSILDKAQTRPMAITFETGWIYHFADKGVRLFNISPDKRRIRKAWARFPKHMVQDVAPKPVSNRLSSSQAGDPDPDLYPAISWNID